MNLVGWAVMQGVHDTAAYRWYEDGVLPAPTRKPGQLILVTPESRTWHHRVTGRAVRPCLPRDQKAGLDRQAARLAARAARNGLTVVKVVTEAGSGMNGRRLARNCAGKALAGAAQDPCVTGGHS